MTDDGENVVILHCRDVKDNSGKVISRNVAVQVTPGIRNRLIIQNQGYIYLNLARYRVFDRHRVTQCYHCYSYHHIANICPNKDKSATCGRCSKSHETKKCVAKAERCINCVKATPNKDNRHCAFSYKCPIYERERNILISRTDYESKN